MELNDWWMERMDRCQPDTNGLLMDPPGVNPSSLLTPLTSGARDDPPPGNLTSWTVRPSTEQERLLYQEQEARRYASPWSPWQWQCQARVLLWSYFSVFLCPLHSNFTKHDFCFIYVLFSLKSDSTITNVCLSVTLSVCLVPKPRSLSESIIQHHHLSSFILTITIFHPYHHHYLHLYNHN